VRTQLDCIALLIFSYFSLPVICDSRPSVFRAFCAWPLWHLSSHWQVRPPHLCCPAVLSCPHVIGSYDGKPDLKETFECGHEADPDFMNLWPSEAIMPGFRRSMLRFFYQADAVHLQVRCRCRAVRFVYLCL
jgi:hypothetical protein